jgi:hypothetical protein
MQGQDDKTRRYKTYSEGNILYQFKEDQMSYIQSGPIYRNYCTNQQKAYVAMYLIILNCMPS